jgi:hypothetical protein
MLQALKDWSSPLAKDGESLLQPPSLSEIEWGMPERPSTEKSVFKK